MASHTPDSECRLHHSLAVCPWASYSAARGLSFLIYKTGLMQSTCFQGGCEDGSDEGLCRTGAGSCPTACGFVLVDSAVGLALSATPRDTASGVRAGIGLRLCPIHHRPLPGSSASVPEVRGCPVSVSQAIFPPRQPARVWTRAESTPGSTVMGAPSRVTQRGNCPPWVSKPGWASAERVSPDR